MVSIHSEMRVTPEGEPEVWANLGDILDWLDTSKISDSALGGVLPLLGLTDIVISLGQNNGAGQTSKDADDE